MVFHRRNYANEASSMTTVTSEGLPSFQDFRPMWIAFQSVEARETFKMWKQLGFPGHINPLSFYNSLNGGVLPNLVSLLFVYFTMKGPSVGFSQTNIILRPSCPTILVYHLLLAPSGDNKSDRAISFLTRWTIPLMIFLNNMLALGRSPFESKQLSLLAEQ